MRKGQKRRAATLLRSMAQSGCSPFRISVLPWRLRRGRSISYTHRPDTPDEYFAVDAIPSDWSHSPRVVGHGGDHGGRANTHLPLDPIEGFRGCAIIKRAANPG